MAVTTVEMLPLHAADSLGGSGGGVGVGGPSTTAAPSASNNTISAAADSSDNQPSTPRPLSANEQQSQSQQQQPHHPYATHHMYTSSAGAAGNGSNMPPMYAAMYSTVAGSELQQQHQQLASGYPSYLNSYEAPSYYQQQPTTLASLDYGNVGGSSTSSSSPLLFGSASAGDYKNSLRYNPYLNPTSSALRANNGSAAASATNGAQQQQHLLQQSSDSPKRLGGENSSSSTPTSVNAAAVSTTSSLSPRVVSSSSPSSTSQQQQQHSASPGSQQLQCKKCGFLCSSEAELSAHISTQHGGSNSPYSTSGAFVNVAAQSGGNPGELLDLDSQKMVYPPSADGYQQQLHSNDPLQSIHSLQQRSLAGWEQSQQDAMSPYLQAEMKGGATSGSAQATHSIQSPYYSPKQSPYHVKSEYPAIKSEYPVIKSEYPVIKSEFAADSQNYVDKSFGANSGPEMCQQQANSLLPVSSSPAEFPSTTTTPQQDQQQYRAQFEPPTSSSALPATNITAKAATWKSNEARRPKTYNCTACNKWFTSSGHLKRHYNTTLHKNAVKSSGQPDPATMPISVHHHPARDPTTKSSRRSKAEAAAAREQQQQQQQQPPVPVQPPEPPRSPPEYVSAETVGLAALSHYSTSPSPTLHGQANSLGYVQQQQPQQQTNSSSNTFQQQYLLQVQAAAAGASNATVLNGHPNGLAGPSVHPETLTSSQMRGLLNSTITTIVTKSEPRAEDHQHQLTNSPMDIRMEMQLAPEQQQQQQQQARPGMQMVEMEQLLGLQQQQAYHLEVRRPYSSNTPSNIPTQSPPPLIISHQQYLEQQQQLMEGNTFCRTQPTPDSIHTQAHSIIAEPYNITVLGTSTQLPPSLQPHSSSNMSPPLQQLSSSSMSPQLRRTITATINSMDSMHTMQPASHQLQQQQQPLQQHIMSSTVLSSTSNTPEQPPSQQQQLPPLDTIRNTIHTPTIRIPSFQQLQQQPGPAVLAAEPTMSYHTIIGNELQHAEQQFFEHYTTQMLTSDGQLLQLIPAPQLLGQSFYRVGTVAQSFAPSTPYAGQQSPQEADLPPSDDDIPTHESSGSAMDGGLTSSYAGLSPKDNQTAGDSAVMVPMNAVVMLTPKATSTAGAAAETKQQKRAAVGGATKRKRNDSGGNAKTLGEVTANGRIKCQQCEKTFTKTCYLTQHINCFHAGEYPFRCEKCGKRFQQKDAYVVHVERHQAAEKAFKCHLCPKHYHHKTDLRRHIEGTHLNKKLHVCDVCEKSFCRFDHLQKHVTTHTRPRTATKRAAAKSKQNAAAYNAAGDDHVASSIDSVVKNDSGSNSSSDNVVHAAESGMKDDRVAAAAAAAAFGSSDESDDQMMAIKTESCDEHEFVLENRSLGRRVAPSFMLPGGEVMVKEIPIC